MVAEILVVVVAEFLVADFFVVAAPNTFFPVVVSASPFSNESINSQWKDAVAVLQFIACAEKTFAAVRAIVRHPDVAVPEYVYPL